MGDPWPLVGRREELGRLVAALVRGQSRAVLVDGAAGVSKTRLAAAAVEVATRRGVNVHRVAATHAAASIPFGACAGLLPGRPVTPTEAGLLREVAAGLVGSASGRVAVWVDNAHLLDPASAALVHHLAMPHRCSCWSRFGRGSPHPTRSRHSPKTGWPSACSWVRWMATTSASCWRACSAVRWTGD